MPRGKENSSSVDKPSEPEKPTDSDEKVDFDEENDPEETMEEESEYEEVEEEEEVEVEVEEIEEEVEEEEEEEEVEEEEDDDDADHANDTDAMQNISIDEAKVEDEDEKKKHAELLSLPPHGSEVYIGGIPHDASGEDLKGFCESIGEVTEVRVMKGKDSAENKGFGFVTFKSVELASKAIDELHNKQFKGKKIKYWAGVSTVELVKDMKHPTNNRGFAFVNYYNHACAEYSRKKMMDPKFKLGDNAPTVSWADPKNADSSATSQVRAVYVKNLPKDVTGDELKKLFEHHGKISKVVLPPAKSGQEKNRIGFVHFVEKSSAMKALKNTERYELNGQVLECSLAKPQVDKSGGSNTQKSGLLPSYPPHVGYNLIGGAYGGLGAGYGAAGLAQVAHPMIHGRGPAPSGMAMMPMLLPDGRIGYVLQQPGMQPQTPPSHHRGGRNGGGGSRNFGSSSKGRNNNASGQGRRYRPY
ncbi:hypothetical protein K1719_043616 [Acacia pycnantha]|nr:hypothetical protein K1719_043616 [Acacia pycnantha]